MIAALRLSFVCACAFAALAAPAWAEQAPSNDPWAGVEVMDDAEMADLRGGVRLPNGIDIDFGAIVTTYSNGVPVLQTQLTWGDAGAIINETIGSIGQDINDMPDDARDALGIGDVTGGVVIDDADGVTALVHNITDGAIQNIIINDANNRDLRQDIAVTMTLPNFDAMQNMLELQHLGLQIDRDILASLGGGG